VDSSQDQHFYVPKLSGISKTICERCGLCAKNLPDKGQECHPRYKVLEELLFENLIVDFTEMSWARECKYLLMFVCTFSGFLIWTEKARAVARCLLKEIIPQIRIPVSVGLDNGPAFMAEVVQLVAKGMGITWKLHTAYYPQSSGKVKHMNRTL
jgi:transposase InsO family protein